MQRHPIPWPGGRSRRGRVLASLAISLLPVPLLVGAAPAAVGSSPTAATSAPTPARTEIKAIHDVTLVTGDVVTLTTFKGKAQPAFRVHPDGPSRGLAVVQRSETGTYVIPQAARRAVTANAIDLELFNVERLVAEGYDDASTKALPLVLDNSDGSGVPKAAPQARATATLKSINSRAVDVPKTKAGAFWKQNDDTGERKALHVGKIWLDAKVDVDLAQSVPQIGAPTLWKAGFDGKGVKVAVLDTGVDATHPDLAGRVSQQQNFSHAADAVDHAGHGTHVAATIGGSGTGNGAKGVAPDADLISGKVLDDTGSGYLSDIIAGIEWATAEHADIVNMSLGTADPDDGTGPLSVAVDQATAEHGTLFVVSAGNSGPDTIGSPASAKDALTVGALNRDGSRPNFSSTGPRIGDYGVKPEISAPGVGIVAARAKGTSLGRPVDDLYTAMDGTSMASPHVAGAAALLKQAHPDWSWQQLKASLVGSAQPGDYRAEEGGSGRVDVARAQEQLAYVVPAAVNLGAAPFVDGAPYKTLTTEAAIHNDAATARTFTLTSSITSSIGDPLPDGAVRLSTNEVTVPAGGAASVTITADPNVLTAETLYSGLVTAVATDSTASVRVPVSFYVEPPLRTITVRGTATNGKPVLDDSFVLVLDENSSHMYEGVFRDGVATVRAKPGTYAIQTLLLSPDAGGEQVGNVAMHIKPEVPIGDHGIELAIDTRKATEVTYRTGRDTEQQVGSLGYWRSTRPAFGTRIALPTDFKHVSLFPTQAPENGTQEITVFSTRTAPILAAKAGRQDLSPTQLGSAKQFEGKAEPKLVDVGDGSADGFAGKDVKGKLVLATPAPGPAISSVIERAGAEGAAAVAIGNTGPGRLDATVGSQAAPAFALPGEDVRDLRHLLTHGKSVKVDLVGTLLSPFVYDLVTPYVNTVPSGPLTVRVDESSHAHVSARIYDRGSLEGPANYTNYIARTDGGFGALYPPLVSQLAVRRGAVLDEWFSVDPRTSYTAGVAYARTGGSLWYADTNHKIQQPGRRTVEFFKVVNTWKLADLKANGTNLWVVGDRFLDPTGLYTMREPADTKGMTLYRNGTQIFKSTISDFAAIPVASGEADYRLEVEARRNIPGWEYSTRVTSTVSFKANPQPDSINNHISIPKLGYSARVDLSNRVRAGKPQQLTVTARPTRAGQAEIAKVQTWISYDDGQAWSELALAPVGTDGKWKATFKVPGGESTPKFATLRTVATDANGHSIDQTVERAFGIR
ncbi:S8 family serine peptidase [Streptomyces sp900116325]|uniref:S8 family serine peptidase n=1 Tax=Streptomyces sp. 900116325 TaxID=3154295 RepID=A0ABV2UHE1_9ACTN